MGDGMRTSVRSPPSLNTEVPWENSQAKIPATTFHAEWRVGHKLAIEQRSSLLCRRKHFLTCEHHNRCNHGERCGKVGMIISADTRSTEHPTARVIALQHHATAFVAIWVNRDLAIPRPRRPMSAVHPIATRNGAARRMTRSAKH